MMYICSEHQLCLVRLRRMRSFETLFRPLIGYNDNIY